MSEERMKYSPWLRNLAESKEGEEKAGLIKVADMLDEMDEGMIKHTSSLIRILGGLGDVHTSYDLADVVTTLGATMSNFAEVRKKWGRGEFKNF